MKTQSAAAILAVMIGMASCAIPTDISYIQDIQDGITLQTRNDGAIRFQPGDQMSIYVHSRNEDVMDMFNIEGGNRRVGNTTSKPYYTIDESGMIDFPIIGLVRVSGMTREDIARTLKYQIMASGNCNDPVVTVEFHNMTFSVLGEVNHPGQISISKDRTTLLEAIAQAGDLNINGLRTNVTVIRKEDSTSTPYKVDLTSTQSIYSTPVYFIKQGDVIYVEPSNMRKMQSKATGNSAYTPAFWISIATFTASMFNILGK